MDIKTTSDLNEHMSIQEIKWEDVDEVASLSYKCFGPDMSLTYENFVNHLKIFPEGQLCLKYKGKIVGSASSLIINFADYGENHFYEEISDNGNIFNHNPNGMNLYGIEVGVDPDYRGLKIGKHLYTARKEICKKLNLKNIIIGGRIPNYYKYADELSPNEYADKVIRGELSDPVLTFQHKNGFQLKKVMPNYLEGDAGSLANATLMEWPNPCFSE